jgi:phthiocerol/phenolphthiocerol synthesis type-I polyketide synthase C
VRELSPVAVVGMAGRFPQAPDLDAFWRLLESRTDAITAVPAGRWDPAEYGVQAVGGFIDEVDLFDAGFFGISPREAEVVDPQQRLLLESVWRALEDAGQPAAGLRGSRTAVYVGAEWHDYELLRKDTGQPATQHSLVGSSMDVGPARVSYLLGLTGPSMTVECGCSSSLVAVHQACMALRCGDIDGALVGGVSLMCTPEVTVGLTRFGGLSPTGRCRAFGAGADGFVRGEGVAAVYLKTLDRAIADGDRVRAVILASAVNNDGGGDSLVTPNPSAQQDLLRRAYRDVGTANLSYVEAHGTGTRRGDLSEASAIGEVLGRADGLPIGSVKTNIGHMEPAAGLVGLIKAVLSLEHGSVPPSLHADPPNPEIDFARLGIRVATDAVPLSADAHVGVNSFGWGGTNAHVVVTALADSPSAADVTTDGPYVLPVSAYDPAALAERLEDVRDTIASGADGRQVAAALAHHRDHFPLRQPVVVDGDPLAAIDAAGEPRRARTPGKTAFVFPGQGAQWVGMGRDLYGVDPAFTESLDRCADALGWTVDEVFDGPLGGVDRVQPALWAMLVSLAAAWERAGVRPDVVIGHSQGEIAAATVAGVLSVADGARVVSRRAEILRAAAGGGRMLAVDLGWDELGTVLAGFEETVTPAVHNGPRSCVLSGDVDSVVLLKEILEADDVFCRLVDVDYASHSPLMDPILPDIRQALAGITPGRGRIPFLSTMDVSMRHDLDAGYWASNLRHPVRFADAVDAAVADGVTHLVEISPHPGLGAALTQLAERYDEPPAVLASLRRGHGSNADLTRAFADAYASGLPAVGPRPAQRPVTAPLPYPWQRKRYWIGPDRRRGTTGDGVTTLSLTTHPWLADHKVHGTVVYPAGGYLTLLRAGVDRVPLRDVEFSAALTLGEDDVQLTTVRRPNGQVSVSTQVEGRPVTHATARTSVPAALGTVPELAPGAPVDFYARCAERHHEYGPAFRWVAEITAGDTHAAATLRYPGSGPVGESAAFWDGVLQVALAVLPGAGAVVPVSARSVHLADVPAEPLVHARRTADGEVDLLICRPDGTPAGHVDGLRFSYLPASVPEDRLLRWVFDPEPRTATPAKPPFTLVGADAGLDAAGAGDPVTVFVAPSDGGLSDLLDAIRDAVSGSSAFVLLTRNARPAPDGSPVDPHAALYVGMATVLQSEYPHLRTRLIDVDAVTPATIAELSDVDGPDVVVLRGERRWVGRRCRGGDPAAAPKLRERGYRLAVRRPGRVDTVTRLATWPREPGPGEVRIRVDAASLNFLDAMKALGVYPDPVDRDLLGLDCAGEVVASNADGVEVGTPVIACVAGAMADEVVVDARLTAPIPPAMTAAQAAALPMVLATAWYALRWVARVRRGETVLIHSATGGVGLAALAVARDAGATVLATAGTEAKRAHLRELGVEHVFDSRTTDWADEVRAATGGRGVDVVLNSLTGAAIPLGLDVLADDGRFVELGKRDIYADMPIDLGAFRKAVSFTAVDIVGLLRRSPGRFAGLLAEAWPHASLLPVTEVPFARAADALRMLANGDHIGKIVLTGPGDGEPVAPDPLPRGRFRADATYLITGGAGALGRSLAEHLLTHGAEHVALLGRGAAEPPPGARYWRADVADERRMAEVLADVRATMPPLAGVFHAAGVLDDATLPNITADSLAKVLRAKVDGSLVLDRLTRSDPLDAFVLFSSVAAYAGLPGQGAYAAANAFLDALAERRAREGLPALSVQWGPVAEVGLAVGNIDRLADRGLAPLRADELWHALTGFLAEETVVGYADLDVRRLLEMYPAAAAQTSWQSLTDTAGRTTRAVGPDDIAVVVRTDVGAVLRIDPDGLDPATPLKTLGLDSLMSLELRNRLEASLGLRLSPTLLWKHGNVTRLIAALTDMAVAGRD